MTTETPAPSAPVAPVATPAPPAAPNTLAEFRAQKYAPETPATPEPPKAPQSLSAEPPEPPDEPETPEAQPAQGPQSSNHRWKDPDTGVTLDLRRRDHRRIKRLLEERSDLARRQAQPPAYAPPPQAPQAPRQAPQAAKAPTLEDFANEADPYLAYMNATVEHRVKEALTQHESQRAGVVRATRRTTAINRAQQAFDAELPQVRERHPDFDDAHADLYATLARHQPRVGRRIEPIVHRLLTSEIKHDLAYHLGTHPDLVERLVNARNPIQQGIELGAIEAQVKAGLKPAASAPPITPPAAPIAPTGGSASPVSLPDARGMNLRQFRANKAKFGMRA